MVVVLANGGIIVLSYSRLLRDQIEGKTRLRGSLDPLIT